MLADASTACNIGSEMVTPSISPLSRFSSCRARVLLPTASLRIPKLGASVAPMSFDRLVVAVQHDHTTNSTCFRFSSMRGKLSTASGRLSATRRRSLDTCPVLSRFHVTTTPPWRSSFPGCTSAWLCTRTNIYILPSQAILAH